MASAPFLISLPSCALRAAKMLFALFCASIFFHSLCLSALAESVASAPDRSFNIPAGEARDTLKRFAAQAGCELMFEPSTIGGVKTNAVRGEFTARDALDYMLKETGLAASHDDKTGAFAVYRAASNSAARAQSAAFFEPPPRPKKK